ncbi:hypothetical protein BpHYR1_018946 [Brachionus plicatilis]|uniref:Uncharacterized protein n=1 Tax=Brachionus plicatilis TaxID=10195 RepID=A0A3M7PVH5_BRAPC|nr:hypothetical protein BpHYR1_018946 [Brachionus plicatilis]
MNNRNQTIVAFNCYFGDMIWVHRTNELLKLLTEIKIKILINSLKYLSYCLSIQFGRLSLPHLHMNPHVFVKNLKCKRGIY